jgi:hypothetical protein
MAFKWGSKTKKWQIEAKSTWHHIGGKSIGLKKKKLRSKGELVIWRTKMQARVELKDSICFKWVQIGAYEFGPWTPI